MTGRLSVLPLLLASGLIVLWMPVSSHGAAIKWNSVNLYAGDGSGIESACCWVDVYYDAVDFTFYSAEFELLAEKDGDKISMYSFRGVEMEYWINWDVANPGDVMDENTVPHLAVSTDEDFWSNWEADEPRTVHFPSGATSIFYLSFAAANYNSPEIFYGWIEMEFHEWEFNVLHSAVTVGGGPLVVGLLPVPEPGTLALVAIGALALAGMGKRSLSPRFMSQGAIGGDSSSPKFFVLGSDVVILGVTHYGGSAGGDFLTPYLGQIESKMHSTLPNPRYDLRRLQIPDTLSQVVNGRLKR